MESAPIYALVRYDRAQHEGFVRASWCRGARRSWEALARHLRRPDVVTLVAHAPTDRDALLGWACVAPDGVVWVYVRRLFERLRRRGLATALLTASGVDLAKPIPALNWSPAAAEIAAAGRYHPFLAKEKAA